ncbi:MAG TPA: SMP-30/gluconolactonase/LRE family protein [Terriglobia bacterium]|jgi:D-xylonolactonase|nr:SMP-30/gluconolactonase/LRE family protein [Terriglobia bacterium]
MEPELICDYRCEIGENPLWHPFEKRLYWCDIATGRMFRYDPASGKHEQFYQGDAVGGFTIQADGSLLLFMAKGAVKIWRESGMTTVIEEIPDERETRFNDVIADPAGRVFCGMMPTEKRLGRLYRLERSGEIKLLLEGLSCPNGMGFSLDRTQMYFTDSRVYKIYRFDYDEQTGQISHQQVFATFTEKDGFPDGMTVDSEGYIWTALWDGSAIARLTPDGKEVRRIAIPARKSSSLIFGGEDLSDIYVTTAGGERKATDGAAAGALFRLRLGVRGVPEFFSRIEV